ncbi:hypothetical protein [Xanthocytophaga agilis]|uniref:Lipoprotein n=1 Tax=Xanthocytophaga agilis TaxID=3048010 RepID=A0AAE3R1F5_9BACT|nr:hypothetical protein [Xanthocytophaga agilis]MDJ1502031.1 hypothetical protein [Xanthocytophaga agilis]
MIRTISTFALLVLVFVTTFGCKDKENIKPANLGSYQLYTNMPDVEFDQIEIKIDNEVAGTLTAPYMDTPVCETTSPGAILRAERTAGTHTLKATAYKNGEYVTSWNTDLNFEANYCKKIRLKYED